VCLRRASNLLGVDPASLVSLIVGEHVTEYVERGRQRVESHRKINMGVRGQTGQTPPGGEQD
jgi:hypothetical protein